MEVRDGMSDGGPDRRAGPHPSRGRALDGAPRGRGGGRHGSRAAGPGDHHGARHPERPWRRSEPRQRAGGRAPLRQPHLRRARLVAGARRRGDGPRRLPPPGRDGRGRDGRRPLDARHRALLDGRRRHLRRPGGPTAARGGASGRAGARPSPRGSADPAHNRHQGDDRADRGDGPRGSRADEGDRDPERGERREVRRLREVDLLGGRRQRAATVRLVRHRRQPPSRPPPRRTRHRTRGSRSRRRSARCGGSCWPAACPRGRFYHIARESNPLG